MNKAKVKKSIQKPDQKKLKKNKNRRNRKNGPPPNFQNVYVQPNRETIKRPQQYRIPRYAHLKVEDELFFKVWRNKIINELIFKELLKICENDSNCLSDRIKIGDVRSLNWIIKRKQWPVLKDILISDRYLYMNVKSIERLICVYNNNEGAIGLNLELMELLVNKKSIQLQQVEVVETAIKYRKYQLVKLFIQCGLPIQSYTVNLLSSIPFTGFILNERETKNDLYEVIKEIRPDYKSKKTIENKFEYNLIYDYRNYKYETYLDFKRKENKPLDNHFNSFWSYMENKGNGKDKGTKNYDIVNSLLSQGKVGNACLQLEEFVKKKRPFTLPYYELGCYGNVQLIQKLINQGLNIDTDGDQPSSVNIMKFAFKKRNFQLVRYLLEFHFHIKMVDFIDSSPYIDGDLEMVTLLYTKYQSNTINDIETPKLHQAHGNKNKLYWVRPDYKKVRNLGSLFESSFLNGHVPVYAFLLSKNIGLYKDIDRKLFNKVIEFNKYNVIRDLYVKALMLDIRPTLKSKDLSEKWRCILTEISNRTLIVHEIKTNHVHPPPTVVDIQQQQQPKPPQPRRPITKTMAPKKTNPPPQPTSPILISSSPTTTNPTIKNKDEKDVKTLINTPLPTTKNASTITKTTPPTPVANPTIKITKTLANKPLTRTAKKATIAQPIPKILEEQQFEEKRFNLYLKKDTYSNFSVDTAPPIATIPVQQTTAVNSLATTATIKIKEETGEVITKPVQVAVVNSVIKIKEEKVDSSSTKIIATSSPVQQTAIVNLEIKIKEEMIINTSSPTATINISNPIEPIIIIITDSEEDNDYQKQTKKKIKLV